MRHTYVRHYRTAREQRQHVTPLGVALGARGELFCRSLASCSALFSRRTGLGRAGRPCGLGRVSGGCGSGGKDCFSGGSGDSGRDGVSVSHGGEGGAR